jgi:hypothetical protein
MPKLGNLPDTHLLETLLYFAPNSCQSPSCIRGTLNLFVHTPNLSLLSLLSLVLPSTIAITIAAYTAFSAAATATASAAAAAAAVAAGATSAPAAATSAIFAAPTAAFC